MQVPVALGVGVYTYNATAGTPLTLVEEASLAGGFLSFKAAHIMYLYDQLRPRLGAEPPKKAKRPTFDDTDDDFDMYARTKDKSAGVAEAERVLAEEEARKAQRGWRL